MSNRKTLKVTRIERRRLILERGVPRVLCPCCGVETETVSEAIAAEFLSLDPRGLKLLIGSGRVHGVVTASGSFRVCKQSLLEGRGPQGVVE